MSSYEGGGMRALPEPERVTPDTVLALTLLNVQTLAALRDIKAFHLETELEGMGRKQNEVSSALGRANQRTQASTVLNEARQVDAAKDQYALENNKRGSMTPTFSDLTPYLKAGSKIATNGGKDSLGNPFDIGRIDDRLRVSPATKETLKDTTGGDTFWGPYS